MLAPVVKDSFNVVGIRVEDESAVIAGVVLRALAGWPVVAVAGCERGLMKARSRLEVGNAERKVDVLRRLFVCGKRERATAIVEPEVQELRRVVPQLDPDDRCDY